MLQRRLGQHGALLFALAPVLVCLLGIALLAAVRPRYFSSYTDAVGYLLEQRSIPYSRVLVHRAWPDTVNSNHYMSNISVQIEGRQVQGRMECSTPEGRSCYIYLQDLNIMRARIPDLSAPPVWPAWLRWAQNLLRW